jgi:3-hydroxyacyl-CoA dehydrogenase / enoyl-CoA hydratase / 3-hydroxybutyryl-CoA epimerase / enoyl-CoA isomerase
VADPQVEKLLAAHRTAGAKPTDQQIEDRLFLVMLLEAVRAWEERIVREPGDVDMGLILGIGFPSFRGGILRWADTEGAAAILDRVEPYRSLGRRFEPPTMLTELAASGGSFYPRPKLLATSGA